MFLMMAEALQFCAVAAARPASAFWRFLCQQQTHAEWTGCSLHDMIQPSFSFLVGAVLPFSLAARAARGPSRGEMTRHAVTRALILTLLGVVLRSINAGRVNWTFEDTLSQIGLGYVFLFLLGMRPARDAWLALGFILVGYWAAFALYPAPEHFDYPAVKVPEHWPFLKQGFEAHWNKNSNLAWAFDTWFLNLFPRRQPFVCNKGGYTTLAFIPTLGTMILGLIAGGVLRSDKTPWAKARWFAIAGVAGIAAGLLVESCGVCPIVKRIWTPSWALYSGGWCFLYLTAFYVVVEIAQWRRWTFPLLVIGSNSIVAYCVANTADTVSDHLGFESNVAGGGPYAPVLHGAILLSTFWVGLYVLHRRKIFIRI
jgi:predicted acyltransferase